MPFVPFPLKDYEQAVTCYERVIASEKIAKAPLS
jgi:hypothetical protein